MDRGDRNSAEGLTAPAWHRAFLTLIAGGGLLLLGLAMARGVARRIIGPIDALRMLSATGNRGAPPAAFATGLREVDQVGRALVASITELEESRAELARVNTGLESRVIEALAASEAAYERLAQGQKIQALGQLAGGIAHDFNNILQTVSGAAAMIERRSEDRERVRRLARVTLEVAARGASITQRLLSFARRGKLSAEPMVTTILMDGMGEVLTHTLGSPITVRTVTAPGTPRIFADRSQLESALVNLGINARDAMPDGGTLTLSAREERVSNGSTHPAGLAPGVYVRIAVTDTGTGMDPATLSRVTEPFFTTKPPGIGTGLGLSIVRGFADQSGGALLIESVPGSGTAVTLWLPQAADDELAPAPQFAKETRSTGQSTSCVLLVDDDDLVRETLAAQLEDLGFMTFEASSGHDAIILLEANKGIDAFVCDLAMPGLNGIQTIRAVRQRRPELPCFLLTGYMGEPTALSQTDTFTLLRKPLSGGALAAHIEAVLAV
jgi:signal transduction histidine kinase/CheY-like chemotaxis protein